MFDKGFTLLILGIVGVGGYFAYECVQNFGSGDGICGGLGSGAPDPGGGAPANSLLDSVLNQFEIGSSSLSESDATQQFLSSPLTTIESILGFNQTNSSPDDGDN